MVRHAAARLVDLAEQMEPERQEMIRLQAVPANRKYSLN
jgi:hypothetical protein